MLVKDMIKLLENMHPQKDVYIGEKSIELLEINSIEEGESLVRIIPNSNYLKGK